MTTKKEKKRKLILSPELRQQLRYIKVITKYAFKALACTIVKKTLGFSACKCFLFINIAKHDDFDI